MGVDIQWAFAAEGGGDLEVRRETRAREAIQESLTSQGTHGSDLRSNGKSHFISSPCYSLFPPSWTLRLVHSAELVERERGG